MSVANRVIADAWIMEVISLVENHERVSTGSFGWTTIKIADCDYVLILSLTECPLVIGGTRRIRRSVSH